MPIVCEYVAMRDFELLYLAVDVDMDVDPSVAVGIMAV